MILTDEGQNRDVSAKVPVTQGAGHEETNGILGRGTGTKKRAWPRSARRVLFFGAWEEIIFSKISTKQQLFQSVLFLQRGLI